MSTTSTAPNVYYGSQPIGHAFSVGEVVHVHLDAFPPIAEPLVIRGLEVKSCTYTVWVALRCPNQTNPAFLRVGKAEGLEGCEMRFHLDLLPLDPVMIIQAE